MRQHFRSLQEFYRYSFSPLFKWGGIVYAILNFFGVLKDVVPPPYSEWRVWDFLPDWPILYWFAIFAIFIAIGAVEGALTQTAAIQEDKGRTLVGIPRERQRQKGVTLSSGFAMAIALTIIILAWRNYSVPRISVVIHGGEIGWREGSGIINLQSTDFAEPNKQWVANVHYSSSTGGSILWPYSSFMANVGQHLKDRDHLEDVLWDQFIGGLTHYPDIGTHIPFGSPQMTTLTGPTLDHNQIQAVINEDQAIYFLMVFMDKKKRLLSSMCIYREGLSPKVHLCHDYNWP